MSEQQADRRIAPTILIVDDDQTSRLLASCSLSASGFEVLEAPDGETALEVLAARRVALVLLDVEMPGIDGFETCKRIRILPEHCSTPVVMITGNDDQQSIEAAFEAGATDFTSKPVNWTVLGHRIRYMLRSGETLMELARAQRIARLGNWTWDPRGDGMSWSSQVYRMLGLAPGAERPALPALLARVDARDREEVRRGFEDARAHGQGFNLKHRLRVGDGEVRVVEQQVEALAEDGGGVLSGVMQDVTEREQSAQRIRRLAYFDSLTLLPNREYFRLLLDKAVALAARGERRLAVMYLDLDDFKRVNDTLGHSAGDELLQEVGRRLMGVLRSSDVLAPLQEEDSETAARLGGDEFAILLSEIHRPEDAALVAGRLLEQLALPIYFKDHEVSVTPSIGIANFPEDGEDPETLLKNADVAMYEAKRAGKNLYRFFHVSMHETLQRRLALEQQMRHALDRDEFSLVYQPQTHPGTGVIEGAEALLRWNSAELGSVSPVEFIPLAEENGLIIPIGAWVLRTACAQARIWRLQGLPLPRVAVNISVLQFVQSGFVEQVAAVLEETGLEPSALELEITESLLAKDADHAVETLNALKRLGVTLSIDDFGTGYSSLSYLKRFPIDRLKIDGSFVRDLVSDGNDAAIVSAVIGMAESMRLKVTAEGVETCEQAHMLNDRGCDELQGYLLSRPLPPEQLAQFLGAHPTERWHAQPAALAKRLRSVP